ncbi:MAG: hypothetical protein VZS44_08035 [Bacilli bacterium]|nr:hypothetical protein [Bacilli bacterium]
MNYYILHYVNGYHIVVVSKEDLWELNHNLLMKALCRSEDYPTYYPTNIINTDYVSLTDIKKDKIKDNYSTKIVLEYLNGKFVKYNGHDFDD